LTTKKPASITRQSYGKSNVRLLKVVRGRNGAPDAVRDLCVSIALEGDFEATYLTGDNRNVVATDTMKNLVYVIGHRHPIDSIESFGCALADHFLQNYPQVSQGVISIDESAWRNIDDGPEPSSRALSRSDAAMTLASITSTRTGAAIESGLRGLDILKTGDSAFRDFHRDQWTTLKDADDRLFRTFLNARWRWISREAVFNQWNPLIRQAMLERFAKHQSLSVQQTLHAMAEAALEACVAIDRISITLPNRHCNLVDLSPFGLKNQNEVYVPTEEPFGLIEATIERR
jgi:urate oxidase